MWVWEDALLSLSCKATLFERLGDSELWPETWVLRRGDAWDVSGTDFFVKHPRRGGGTGTRRAHSVDAARSLAHKWLQTAEAAVIQRAVQPAELPLGPSIFELRVWGILRRGGAWVWQNHRAKTALRGCNLMNRRVQQKKKEFGAFYDHNIASEQHIRDALPGYDDAKLLVREAVRRVHAVVRDDIPPTAFFFVGFDFILDSRAHPYLIEANIKPPARFENIDVQFPSPIVRRMASDALDALAHLMQGNCQTGWIRVDA
ncbi:hypothetical protein CTAYLR_009804 [Chrysophaeum taylorii]|uniref:Tubulin-tyrosine ligase n=1 Tax=Chrysophaeum taylorii TaxID=2483200 RepID=A0AAD7XTS8_9STRA|nr:hypothetical protein CTAYLR_009804 [Chrysophaeum taylorii]